MLQTAKTQKLHPQILPFQIFQAISNSKISKPTSQNVASPNLPSCLKQQQIKNYIPKWCLFKSSKMPQTAKAQNLYPKILPFQIFQDASNSKSSKPTSQNIAFSNLPRCLKQQKLKIWTKILPFSNLPRCPDQQKIKTYIRKCCLSKSSKLPQAAKDQNLHPKMLPLQNFQDASSSKSSKPTSQNVAFPNLPTVSNSKSSTSTFQNAVFPNPPRCLKQQQLKT